MRFSVAILLGLTLEGHAIAQAPANPDAANEIAISIRVPERNAKRMIDLRAGKPFDVVITNTSKQELRFWDVHNSWGYYNLTFDVLDQKGNVKYSIVKKPVSFTRNVPKWIPVKAGGHHVLKVNFDPSVWVRDDLGVEGDQPMHVPFLHLYRSSKVFSLRLRPVFRITPDSESMKRRVWTGVLKAPNGEYVVKHSPAGAPPQVDIRSDDGSILIDAFQIHSYNWSKHRLTIAKGLKA